MIPYPPRGCDFHDPAREVPRPIFGVDIDGTLGEYHFHFTRFASEYLGKRLPPFEEFTSGSFAAHLGLSKSTYRKVKLAYRRGGLKRSMPVVDGASALTGSLRKRGAVVLLCTTRPYLSLETVDDDTRHWAKRNRIQHDGIAWGPNKYVDLSRLGFRVVSVVDDEPELLNQAMSVGLTANRINQPYNLFSMVNGYGCRTLREVSEAMHEQLSQWEADHR